MGLVGVCVVVGLLASLASGGRLSAMESLPVYGWTLLAGAAGAQVLGLVLGALGVPAGAAYGGGMLVSGLLVAVFLAVNRALAGTVLVAAGLLLNTVVIVANGAMPVSAHAAARSGAGAGAVADARHEPADSHTVLGGLGDVVPVPLPVHPEVDSVGDLLAAAGLGQLAFAVLRPRRARRSVAPAVDLEHGVAAG